MMAKWLHNENSHKNVGLQNLAMEQKMEGGVGGEKEEEEKGKKKNRRRRKKKTKEKS